METKTLHFLKKATLLALIENSIESSMFKTIFFENQKKEKIDVLEEGNLSCTYYVSSLLTLVGMIDGPRTTVNSLKRELLNNDNFIELKKDQQFLPGDILFWNKTIESNGHPHVGFFVGNNKAVSNSSKTRKIISHHFTYEDQRNIEAAFRVV